MKLLPLVLPLALLASSARAQVSPKLEKAETKAFARADKDGDEKVSHEEFKSLLKALPAAQRKFPVTGRGDDPAELLELCDGLFEYFDITRDGSVDLSEWFGARQGYYSEDIADLLVTLPGLDRNGNGKVRLKEFLPLVKCFIPASHAKKAYRQIVTGQAAANGGSSGGSSTEIINIGYDWGSASGSGTGSGSGGIGSGGPQTGNSSNNGSGTTAGTTAGTTSGGRGSGGPQTGVPLVIGGGTTTGTVTSGASSSDITATWSSSDPSAAAAWVAAVSANDNPARSSGLVNPWEAAEADSLPQDTISAGETISEEGRGQR